MKKKIHIGPKGGKYYMKGGKKYYIKNIKGGLPSLQPYKKKCDIDDIVLLCKKINPDNTYGKISLIVRLGINYITKILPQLIDEVSKNKLNVLWLCDPMHGNTIQTSAGLKTRSFDTIKKEIECFFNIHNDYSTIPGGLHFELTGDNVTECIGGINNLKDNDLKEHYHTACDPRLNNEQSLEMSFLIAELLKKGDVSSEQNKN